MKKIYLFILFVAISAISFGQLRRPIEIKNDKVKTETVNVSQYFKSPLKSSKNPTDTIFADEFLMAGSPVKIQYVGGGWVFGVNVAGCKEVAQGIRMDLSGGYSHYAIEGLLVWVAAAKKTSVNGSTLKVNICEIDDSSHYGTSTVSYDISCPGTIKRSIDYPWNPDFDTLTSQWSYLANIPVSPPVYTVNDYAVVLNFDDYYLNNDTIGVIASALGGASNYNGLEYTWWKYPSDQDFWTLTSDVFANMDRALAIWPVIDAAGIHENAFLNGLKLGQNSPNPTNNNSIIEYALEKAGNVTLEVYNTTGKLVSKINEGKKAAGVYSINLDITKYPTGTYYYSLTCDNNRMTRKMVITK